MPAASANGRLYGWAHRAAVATLGTNVAFWAGLILLRPPFVPASEYFGPGAFWLMTVGPLASALCLLAVVLGMEYRVRSLGSGDPERQRSLRRLVLLVGPTLLHVVGLVALVLYALLGS